ncbi:hypothetical protein CQZ93_14205 [Ochrobactrum vermis]|nr:hypothetical protein CQZ93_14205 [Ochrobactrum vermis]
MKSWGERILAGLKNWRSRRNDGTTDEIPDVEGVADQSPEPPDQEPDAILSIKISAKDFDGTGAETIPKIEPVNPSVVALVNTGELQTRAASSSQAGPETEVEADGKVTIAAAPTSPQKRSRVRKPKITDGQVTDEELAELEAENARLKLLLRERMQVKRNNSEN